MQALSAPTLDAMLAGGVLVALLGVTGLLAALADGRWPVIPVLLILGGAGAAGWAAHVWPGGIALDDLPEAAVRVTARILR